MPKNEIIINNLIGEPKYTRKMYVKDMIISVMMLLFIVFIFVLTNFWISTVEVRHKSMTDTLQEGDILILDHFAKPKRFDIVVFETDKSNDYIKRVIGIPGDIIYSVDGIVYIDRVEDGKIKTIKEDGDYIKKGAKTYKDFGLTNDIERIEVLDGYYYVLGDNRENSEDSRVLGLISKDKLKGVVHNYWIDHKDFLKKIF